jgi:tetratricopeptide (TPR) repeat protein
MQTERIELDPRIDIVIATSDRDVAFNTQKMLKTAGFNNVLHLDDPNALIPHCSQNKVDILIIDSELGSIQSWLFIKTLKTAQNIPNIPTVYMEKKPCQQTPQELAEYGIMSYLQQPVQIKSLTASIAMTYAGQKFGNGVEAKYAAAKTALLNKRTDDAIATYEDLASSNDKNTRSTVGLAQAYEENRETHKASKIIEQSKDVNDINIQMMKMRLALSTENESLATELAQQILKLTDYSEVYVKLCVEASVAGKAWVLSSRLVKTATKRSIKNADIYLLGARAGYYLGDLPEANHYLDEAEKISGVNLKTLEIRGRCQLKAQDYNGAIQTYSKAAALDPNSPQSLFNRALAFAAVGRLNEAIADVQHCLRISPSFVLAEHKLKELQAQLRKAG